jgi:hypothetical protein
LNMLREIWRAYINNPADWGMCQPANMSNWMTYQACKITQNYLSKCSLQSLPQKFLVELVCFVVLAIKPILISLQRFTLLILPWATGPFGKWSKVNPLDCLHWWQLYLWNLLRCIVEEIFSEPVLFCSKHGVWCNCGELFTSFPVLPWSLPDAVMRSWEKQMHR